MNRVRTGPARSAPSPALEVSEFTVRTLLQTRHVAVREVCCQGRCRHRGGEECASVMQLVFPYRGVFVRHRGSDRAVGQANQVVMFNPTEGYQISHPVPGGDESVVVTLDDDWLRELVPAALERTGAAVRIDAHARPVGPGAQLLLARLRAGLRAGLVVPGEAEALAIALVGRVLGPRRSRGSGPTPARRRLADRVKLVLARDVARRWTLADVAGEVGASPVYLTQVFRQVEGVPLYRYQLRLRLAHALERLGTAADLSGLAFELGFSSHSHFSAAFQAAYGCSPSTVRRQLRGSSEARHVAP